MKKTMLAVLACFLLLSVLAACAPLAVINALSSRSDTRVSAGIPYGDGPRLKLDVYAPEGAKEAPVVLFFYGGTWNSGARQDYAFVGHALASRGMVAVIADYRLYPEIRYPDFLEDSAKAAAWTVRNIGRFGGDPRRLVVMGHSAGAYNAAMLALDARWLQAQGLSPSVFRGWIGLAGPYDFLPIQNPEVKPIFHHPDTPKDSQPLYHAGKASPPALLIAAREDKLVDPERNTAQLAAALRSAGVPVREVYYDSVGHATLIASLSAPMRGLAPTLDEIARFIDSPLSAPSSHQHGMLSASAGR